MVLLGGLAFGCGGSDTLPAPIVPVASVAVVLAPRAVVVGQSAQAVATVRSADGLTLAGRAVAWSTSNPTVATVSADGLVTGVGLGVAVIQATSEGISGIAELAVRESRELAVGLGPGVAGAPAAGQAVVPLGDTVAYEYRLADHYRDLVVLLDGVPVPTGGRVVMDRAHTLVAGADSVIPLVPEAVGLVAPTRALLADPNPGAAMRAITAIYDTILLKYPSWEADTQIREANAEAFRDADPAAMLVLMQRLDGESFNEAAVRRERPSVIARDANPVEPKGVALIYVNGILSYPPDAFVSKARLAALASGVGYAFGGSAGDRVASFYNATWTLNPNYSRIACTGTMIRHLAANPASLMELLNACTGLNDLSTATLQTFNVMNGFPLAANAKAESLADSVRTQLSAGRAVLLVGHSQGNLVIQEALRSVYGAIPPGHRVRAAKCIATISVAAPTSGGFPAAPGQWFAGVVVKGRKVQDIVLSGLLNHDPPFVRLATNVSDEYDARLAATPFFLQPLVEFGSDFRLHDFDASYLGGDRSRAWIVQQLANARAVLRQACKDSLSVTPDTLRLRMGGSGIVQGAVLNALGDVVPGLSLTWMSLNPAIATVAETGAKPAVTGVSTGSTKIVASAGAGGSDTVVVTVGNVEAYSQWSEFHIFEGNLSGCLTGQANRYRLSGPSDTIIVFSFSDAAQWGGTCGLRFDGNGPVTVVVNYSSSTTISFTWKRDIGPGGELRSISMSARARHGTEATTSPRYLGGCCGFPANGGGIIAFSLGLRAVGYAVPYTLYVRCSASRSISGAPPYQNPSYPDYQFALSGGGNFTAGHSVFCENSSTTQQTFSGLIRTDYSSGVQIGARATGWTFNFDIERSAGIASASSEVLMTFP